MFSYNLILYLFLVRFIFVYVFIYFFSVRGVSICTGRFSGLMFCCFFFQSHSQTFSPFPTVFMAGLNSRKVWAQWSYPKKTSYICFRKSGRLSREGSSLSEV